MNDLSGILQLVVLTGAAITGIYIIARATRSFAHFVVRVVRGCIELKRRADLVYEAVATEMHPNCGGSMKDLIESFVHRFEQIEVQLAQLIVSDDGATVRRYIHDAVVLSDSSPAVTETE